MNKVCCNSSNRLLLMLLINCTVFFVTTRFTPAAAQCDDKYTPTIENIANSLVDVKYEVLANYDATAAAAGPATGRISLTWRSPIENIFAGNWEIYFTALRSFKLHNSSMMQLSHVNGMFFKLVPTSAFFVPPLTVSVTELTFDISDATVSRSDSMPNWYVTQANCSNPAYARIISKTATEDLGFVGTFERVEQWKRSNIDQYSPYTAEHRYDNNAADQGPQAVKWRVIPTPAHMKIHSNQAVNLRGGDWVVMKPPSDSKLNFEANFLAEKLQLPMVTVATSNQKAMHLSVGSLENIPSNSDEAYVIQVSDPPSNITVTGAGPSGVFYGIQTLVSLSSIDGFVPHGTVRDWPRYQHRGNMVDVARNFHSQPDDVRALIDAMAMYKMNRLHLHLSDDEGWRLEIDGLPELTEIGGHRCHDLTETQCVITQLGSSPTGNDTGSGWFSTSDYRSILSYAAERHIKVIPEFDMPGHAHAAITAMLARYRKSNDATYLLSDLDDKSKYRSVQGFTDNAVNPCVNSTYAFIEHVLSALVDLHRGIQHLTIFHFGGDEVPASAWSESPACKELGMTSEQLKSYFVRRVSEISQNLGVELACWEDGLYSGSSIIEKKSLASDVVYANAWNNVWEWGSGKRAYELANAEYKVILSHATHLYFDFPAEPDPEERGLYWATRTIGLKKVFSYQPDSIYDNMDVDVMGNPINKTGVCQQNNSSSMWFVAGIQSQVFGETTRSTSQFHFMLFPRLLAVAERAWHKSDEWESLPESRPDKQTALNEDWTRFANTLGYKELRRLDALGIRYRVPPPGARLTANNELQANCELPGLRIRYRTAWMNFTGNVALGSHVSSVTLDVTSADGLRSSRQVSISTSSLDSGSARLAFDMIVSYTLLVATLSLSITYQT